jgi:predicted DNA-binding protein
MWHDQDHGYLPNELEARLNAEASATGISKAELIREGIAMRLNTSTRVVRDRALPVLTVGDR